MRARWAVALTAAVTVALGALGGAAAATDPVSLGTGYVLDDAGALSSSELQTAEAQLSDLYASTGADLYVVFVDEFTNPANSQQWADEVAQDNGLGVTQYLLAVATESRQYYISADSTGPMSDRQLSDIEGAIRPDLSDGDYAGAIATAAAGMTEALGGGGSGGGVFTTLLVLAAIAAAIALVVWLVMRSRRKKRGAVAGGDTPAEAEQIPTSELAQRASSALVQTDDALRTSAQELGFARAQFGDEATTEFAQALAQAQANLNEAFTLKQQLDDDVPDSEADTRAWNTRILALCDEANTALDEKAAAFDELRKLEQNAPEALARVQEQRATAAASLEAAATRLAALTAAYAPEALATVADNPDQARQRLAFAHEQLEAAQAAIGAGKGGEAAVGIRAAEEAVSQAMLLEDAIERLATDLAEGERNATALIAELEHDVAIAAGLPDSDGRIARVIASTTQQIDAAKANLAGSAKRPLLTLQSLDAANTQIDAVVQGVRDAQAQAQRDRQMVGQLIMQAQAQVSAAEDYITARRGAVGAQARTRLAEAGAALVRAQQLQADDPPQALQHAQRADQLAAQSIQLAQGDVGGFGGAGSAGMFGGGSAQGGDGMLGAVLGGIVINSLLSGGGGGRGRSSGGGSIGGMFGGSGGGGRGGGRIRPGSFGGGGTRGRRGGGRF